MSKFIPESASLDDVVMTGEELMDATTTVVRAMGRDKGLDIAFRGDGAYTDGENVVLPSLGENAQVTKRQALVLGGYANHETLHTLLTDFKGLRPKLAEWHNEGKHLTKAMANAIEDVRIENGGKTLYQGIPQAVDKTAREVNRQFIDKVYKRNKKIVNDFGKIGPVAVTWAGRKLLGYQDESNQEALDLLPNRMRDRVMDIARQAMGLEHGVVGMGEVNKRKAFKGSRDGAELAERLIEEYMNELNQEQQQQQQQAAGNGDGADGDGQSGDKSQGDRGAGDATGDGKSQGAGEGEGDGQGSGKDGDYSNENGGDIAQGEGQHDQNSGAGAGDVQETASVPEPQPIDPNLDTVIEHVVKGINTGTPDMHRVLNPSGDLVVDMLRDENWGIAQRRQEFRRLYQDIKSQSSSVLSTIRRKLERALMAQAETYWENGKRTGRLDVSRNASKIINFKPNIFRNRQSENKNNTAMAILVDCSGSMCGHELYIATQASIAICEALEPMHVPIEVTGHHTFGGEGYREAQRQRSRKRNRIKFGRMENIILKVFKSFDDTLQQCRPALAAMAHADGGANADGDAIKMAAKRLLKREEPRKVMFVMSDGRPAYSSELSNEHQYTRDCVQWVQDQGIEIVGLGICDASVRQYYHKCIVVNDINEFATTYINEVVALLMGKDNGASNLIKHNKLSRRA